MQYDITLPADYDMTVIRERVATRGHALDDRAGLGLKAYLIRERGVAGSPVNQYAPFYLWHDAGRMGEFLVGGGGFQGIVADFGRPAVRQWSGLAVEPGPARGTAPRAASRLVTSLPETADLTACVAEALAGLRALGGVAGLHTAALALDPGRWRLMTFALWEREAPGSHGDTEHYDAEHYEVLHVSAPGLALLREGRAW
ncbi:DUF4865 family protein [Microbispora amethystogenes]|nr:DUF4865 family protein [Microbispora amethystogenes]